MPQAGFDLALDHLRNSVVNAADPGEGAGEPLAYALYVLARNGRPVIGDLRYLADTKQAVFTTPLAKAQIAAALAMLGDRARAGKGFAAALDALEAEQDDGLSRPDYGSTLARRGGDAGAGRRGRYDLGRTARRPDRPRRRRAGARPRCARLHQHPGERLDGARRRGARRAEGAEPIHRRRTAGRRRDLSQMERLRARPEADHDRQRRQGDGELVTTASGVPIAHDPAASEGYALERTFYKLDGSKTDLKAIAQNERVVVVLKITESEARYAKLLVVDRLPAGLEIDNPTLFDSGSIDAFSWLKKDIDPVHAEYRDDRFVAAFDREPGQSAFFTVAYVVRAVAPGLYVYPPATAEDMYRPDRFGRTAFGAIEVTAK